MRKAYLGIVDHTGLRMLVPETGDAQRFMLRRAVRSKAVCFWSVIDEALVAAIRMELERGQFEDALCLLQLLAHDLGAIPPGTYARENLRDTA